MLILITYLLVLFFCVSGLANSVAAGSIGGIILFVILGAIVTTTRP